MKRGYHGVYHHMSPKHVDRYVNEFTGRHNIRKIDTELQIAGMMWSMENKRLRYQEELKFLVGISIREPL